MDGDAGTTGVRIVENATCLGCGCLCDDIGLVVEGDRVVEARRVCGLGLAWYERGQEDLHVGPMVAGQPASFTHAIDRAVEVLARARAPIVLGLGDTIESQRAAVAIADRIGAAITPYFSPPPSRAAFQRLGAVAATLGEIRDRADLIVFESPHLPTYFPRFLERFVDPPGRFVPEGRAGRTVIVFQVPGGGSLSDDAWNTPPDLVLDLPDLELDQRGLGETSYAILRGLVNGVAFDPVRFEAAVGAPLSRYVELAERFKRARYGVLLQMFGWPSGQALAEVRSALVRDLNRSTRFVALGLPRFAQESGAEAVLAWQAGGAGDVDFALGHPRHLPLEVAERIERGEADAILLIGDLTRLSGGHEAAFAEIRKVVVGPVSPGVEWTMLREERERLLAADAFLPTARAGIDEGGTVARFDGVMLPLRPPFPGLKPSQADVLRAILQQLEVPRDSLA